MKERKKERNVSNERKINIVPPIYMGTRNPKTITRGIVEIPNVGRYKVTDLFR